MKAQLVVTLLMAGVVGCARETPIPFDLRTPPFHMLQDVALGMKAAELSASRSVASAPDQRYAEEVAGYAVHYEFDQSERLRSVGVTEGERSAAAGLLRYTRTVLEATRMLGVTPECRYHEPSNSMVTVYQLKDAFYEISYTPGRDLAAVTRSYRKAPSSMWSKAKPQRCVR